jgi:hypothetical protein
MELFGTVKGVQRESLAVAAERGLEQVRLHDSQHVTAGNYSGGMRRRLSVAIALIGNPQVAGMPCRLPFCIDLQPVTTSGPGVLWSRRPKQVVPVPRSSLPGAVLG